jgi:hypothetical protein
MLVLSMLVTAKRFVRTRNVIECVLSGFRPSVSIRAASKTEAEQTSVLEF